MSANAEYKVNDKATLGLNLRSQPVVDPSTKLAVLPIGQLITKKAESATKPWWEVLTTIQGTDVDGFVNSKYLTPVATFVEPAPHSSLSPVHLRNPGINVTRSGIQRAYALNEPNQPTRNGNDPAQQKVEELTTIIEWLKVDQSARYQPAPKTTYCNIYAYDYAYLSGVYLPRVWWTADAIHKLESGVAVSPKYGDTVDELNANSLFDWFKNYGTTFGWTRAFDLTQLQNAANDGQVVIISAKQKDLHRSGHICAIVPETPDHMAVRSGATVIKPLQSQAGKHNHPYFTIVWWNDPKYSDFGFWIHA